MSLWIGSVFGLRSFVDSSSCHHAEAHKLARFRREGERCLIGRLGCAVTLIDTGLKIGRGEWCPVDKIGGVFRDYESIVVHEILQETHLE
jgi:hypothetical protein